MPSVWPGAGPSRLGEHEIIYIHDRYEVISPFLRLGDILTNFDPKNIMVQQIHSARNPHGFLLSQRGIMEPSSLSKDFIHPNLDEEISALAGYYVLTKEIRHPFNEREILYFLGSCVLENSCCGCGSCLYAIVSGFVTQWKYKKATDGRPVSRVEPIRGHALQNDIRSLIQQKEEISQVDFDY